jgi:hypothetical protein
MAKRNTSARSSAAIPEEELVAYLGGTEIPATAEFV